MLKIALSIALESIVERAAASMAPKEGNAPPSFNFVTVAPNASISIIQANPSSRAPHVTATVSRSENF